MQTFLPYDSFTKTAQCLDYMRLGKQRVEAYQILRVLTGESQGWKNHPAVKMWKGYEYALTWYGYVICSEWIMRGYKDQMLHKFVRGLSEGDSWTFLIVCRTVRHRKHKPLNFIFPYR